MISIFSRRIFTFQLNDWTFSLADVHSTTGRQLFYASILKQLREHLSVTIVN